MARIIGSPSRYIQGKGTLSELTKYTKQLGKKMLVLVSKSGKKRVEDKLNAAIEGTDSSLVWEIFNGECSRNEINRIGETLKAEKCDIVVGIGGGKILDTAKAVAYYENISVVCVPTAASTDAPCSALSVVYTDDGQFEEYLWLPANPDIVLLDTDIVAAAPARLIISGMGDALATYFETRACMRSNAISCMGGSVSKTAMALSELCFNTLMADGAKAKLAVEAGACTPAVDNVIEANTYLSGIGFESGGIAAAHAIHNGLTCIEETHHMYHGEKVAFGVISQLIMENVSTEDLEQVVGFCIEVGLPVTLEDLGIKEINKDKIMEAATLACAEGDTAHNMPFEVTPESVYNAMLAADRVGHYYKDWE